MNVVLNRIDERLIHGQVLISWARKLQAQCILVIDDQLAQDRFAQSVLAMTVPGNLSLRILGAAAGSAYLREHVNGTAPDTILLVRNPQVFHYLLENGYRPASINVGAMAPGENRHHLRRGVYVSDQDTALFREFLRQGIDVYLQMIYSESRLPMDELI